MLSVSTAQRRYFNQNLLRNNSPSCQKCEIELARTKKMQAATNVNSETEMQAAISTESKLFWGSYDQCEKCVRTTPDESKKPFGDYFLCECYGTRRLAGFGPELEHWADALCSYCSKEQQRCRTCGKQTVEKDLEEDEDE